MPRVAKSKISFVIEALLIAVEDSECGYTKDDLDYLSGLLSKAEGKKLNRWNKTQQINKYFRK